MKKNSRLLAIIKKEFIQMRRDRLTLALMLVLPFMQILLFGYAINTDVKHLPMAVCDLSRTRESRELIETFVNSDYFDVYENTTSYDRVVQLIHSGKVRIGIVISPDYSKNLKAQRQAEVQVLIDSSDPMVASTALSNSSGIGNLKNMEILMKNMRADSGYSPGELPLDIRVRGWYNPDLQSSVYIVPGIIGVILMMTMMMITSMAIVRERETGTLEQLITTPIQGYELMIGKIVPYILLGYAQITIALLIGKLLFNIPFRGNLFLLYALTLIFNVCYLGLGLLVSTLTRTQQQAMQLSFFIFLPNLLLSGYMFPVEGMPKPAQYLSSILPMTYYLRILRGIILKGVGIKYLWPQVIPMLIFMTIIFTISIHRFRKSMD